MIEPKIKRMLRRAVKRGVPVVRALYGDTWFRKLKESSFDMSDGHACMLGQLGGGFLVASKKVSKMVVSFLGETAVLAMLRKEKIQLLVEGKLRGYKEVGDLSEPVAAYYGFYVGTRNDKECYEYLRTLWLKEKVEAKREYNRLHTLSLLLLSLPHA